MDTKLTLKLDSATIKEAKEYAKNTRTSISQLVENYLKSIVAERNKKRRINPIVKSLTGVIKLGENDDYKSDYSKYIADKYK